MAREKYDFKPSVVAAMERPPRLFVRLISVLIMLFVIIAIAWLYLARVDIVVTTQGKIVPSGKIKIVQAADQGIVKTIHVTDGQVVKTGDPLLTLDNTNSEADEHVLTLRRDKTLLMLRRLRAELGHPIEIEKDLDVPKDLLATELAMYRANIHAFDEGQRYLRTERDQVNASIQVFEREVNKIQTAIKHLAVKLNRKRSQAQRGLIAEQEVENTEFELQNAKEEKAVAVERVMEARSRLIVANQKISNAVVDRNQRIYQELSEAEHQLKSVEQGLIKATDRSLHQILRAPVGGVVQQLAIHTLGAVVTVGQNITVIIPENAKLEMDARILNKDIGFVNTNHPVNVKIDAFEYTRFGSLEGEIQWVGVDAIVDEDLGPIYPAKIILANVILPNKVNGRIAKILPGMRATADIVIGKRRLFEYVVGPLLRYKDESLRER